MQKFEQFEISSRAEVRDHFKCRSLRSVRNQFEMFEISSRSVRVQFEMFKVFEMSETSSNSLTLDYRYFNFKFKTSSTRSRRSSQSHGMIIGGQVFDFTLVLCFVY